jgi:hypothetical protein
VQYKDSECPNRAVPTAHGEHRAVHTVIVNHLYAVYLQLHTSNPMFLRCILCSNVISHVKCCVLYISTSRNMCAVLGVAVFYGSLVLCFLVYYSGLLLSLFESGCRRYSNYATSWTFWGLNPDRNKRCFYFSKPPVALP